MAPRHTVRAAVYILLEREGKILLARRANTGYSDGMYQMPSGHIERDEFPVAAVIRETKEEVGVDILPTDLKFVHASYRLIKNGDAGDYVDYFFKTDKWSGELKNTEPDKCDELCWAAPTDLPENTVPAIKKVMEYINKRIPFSQIS